MLQRDFMRRKLGQLARENIGKIKNCAKPRFR
jgi:hypothetical protein